LNIMKHNKETSVITKIKFLKICSRILKLYAWLIIITAAFSAILIVSGRVPNMPSWAGVMVMGGYIFIFVLIYTIALVADIVIRLLYPA